MINYVKYLCIFLACAATSKKIKVKDCGSSAKLNFVDVQPCKREPCKLEQGKTYSMIVNFTPSQGSKALESKVCGKVGPVCIPFPLPEPDSCKQVTCPIEEGQTYEFATSLPILSSYPKLHVVGKWQVKGDDGDQICFYIPIKIVAPKKSYGQNFNSADENEPAFLERLNGNVVEMRRLPSYRAVVSSYAEDMSEAELYDALEEADF